MKCKEIIRILEELAPPRYAEDWDNSGFLIGDTEKEVKKIMIALDATEEVINEAVLSGVDFLITHHPLIFKGIKNVTTDDFTGRRILRLAENKIAYYAMHTNFDTAVMAGIAEERLHLTAAKVLSPVYLEKYYKIVVFVPKDSTEKVRNAMTKAGAGFIGEYSDCTFTVSGTGTFFPRQGTNPYIGKHGELAETQETRIETIVEKEQLNFVINAMLKVHPYEEAAYDVYELYNAGKIEGIGRIGYFKEKMKLKECAQLVKEAFHLTEVKVTGNLDKDIFSAAVCPGAGKSMIKDAVRCGADVLITGDIDHHSAIDAKEQGLALIDGGHFGTEIMMAEYVMQYLQAFFNRSYDIFPELTIITAKEKSPFQIL